MYQDSGLFLRGGPPSGFADRRVARRMEQGVAPPRAWRNASGTVLRLSPQRLAELAGQLRAIAPSMHPAADDPHAAVLERVGVLARDARPAGTFHDPATGQRLHLFRSGGRWGGWELVTAPPRGALFDIVAVRPAPMQGELEVFQANAPGYQVNNVRVRGAHATVNWISVPMTAFIANPNVYNRVNVVYVVSKTITIGQAQFAWPRYVGEAGNLVDRWGQRIDTLRMFDAPLGAFTLWVGTMAPLPNVTLQNHLAQVHLRQGQADTPAKREELIRGDIEHVMIRWINNELPSRILGTVLAQMHAQNVLTVQAIVNDLLGRGVVPAASQAAAIQAATAFVQALQGVQGNPTAQQLFTNLVQALAQQHVPVRFGPLRLLNEQSIHDVLSDPQQGPAGGISLINAMVNNGPAPWFLPQPLAIAANQQFEIPV